MFYRKFVFGKSSADSKGMEMPLGEDHRPAMSECVSTWKDNSRELLADEKDGKAIAVSASDLYEPEKGYGFVTEENRRQQERLRFPELNSGFEPVYWYQDETLTHLEEDEAGCFLRSDKSIAELEQTEKRSESDLDVDECFEAGAANDLYKKALKEDPEEKLRRIPLIFKLDVPQEGNYRVIVKIRTTEKLSCENAAEPQSEEQGCSGRDRDAKDTSFALNSDWLIFTGRRRLGYCGKLQSDLADEFTCSMMVNVCDIIPRGQTEAYTDTTLDIAFLSARPRISELIVEEVDCATVYIAGDSTVTDQSADYPYAPGTSYAGWGQMLSAYLTDAVALSNHAHSGLTTESFREEGHWAIVEKYMREGDYCLFQFGHNDQKLAHLKAQGGYRENLERYIGECRQKGVHPILVTPLARNSWKGQDGSYNDLLAEYAEVCKEIGGRLQVPVLDLHERSKEWITQNGREAVRPYFYPDDYTHTNDYGAYRMAGYVAQELAELCPSRSGLSWANQPAAKRSEGALTEVCSSGIEFPWKEYLPLADCVTAGFGEWTAPAHIALPQKPAGYESFAATEAGAQPLSDIKDPEKPASRADVLDMVIQTVRFFYTNVYNDMFDDIVGHEWYAGAVECAYQNGIIDEHLAENGCFYPEKAVTLEEFLSFAINGYKSRKDLPPEQPCAYDKVCSLYAVKYVRAACALGLLAQGEDLHRVITRGEAARLCRKMRV